MKGSIVTMKCKKIISILLCFVLTPLFTLNVCASENDGLQALQETLNQNIEESQKILDAIDQDSSIDDIGDMINNLEEPDTSVLEADGDAPVTGSLGDFSSSAPPTSLMLEFIKAQLELANSVKNNAMPNMDDIHVKQYEETQLSQFIQQLNDLKSQAYTEPVVIPGDILYYMDEKGLSYPVPKSGRYNASECDSIIRTLDDRISALGIEIMDSLVSIQNFMSEYNSYISNAYSYLLDFSNSSASPSQSQSLFSSEGGQVNVTPVAVSVLAGVLAGMLLMWAIMKNKLKKPAKEESI